MSVTYPQHGQQGPDGPPGYPQQGFPPPGHLPLNGGPGYPPPSGRDPRMVVAVVIVGVALLAGIGVTGFVAPGFFLSDGTSTAQDDDSSGAQGGREGKLPTDTETPAGDDEGSNGREGQLPTDTGDPGAGSGEGEALIEDFTEAVNDKQIGEVHSMLCPNITDTSTLEDVLAESSPTMLLAASTTKVVTHISIDITFTAMARGEPIVGLVGAHDTDETGWCVNTFVRT